MNGSQLKNALTRYISFTQMDTRPDREKGKRDGTQNYPAAGSNDLSPHELERVSQAKASMSSYFRQLHDMESRLQQEISQREQERDNGYLSSKESVIREKEAAIENLQQQYGPGSETHHQLASDLEHRAEETRRIELLVNRPLRAHFRRSYFAILALLSLLEVPINKLAFEFFFEESPVIAFVLALTVGGVLIALAHFLGMWLRQWGYHRNFSETGKANTAGIATVLLVVGTLIYLVSALRQQYVDFLSQEQSSSMSSMLMQDGITGFLGQSVTSGLGSAGLTLLVVNVAVFMLGTMLSMLRHDSHPDYERVVGLHEVAQSRMNRFLRQFEKKAAGIQARFDDRIAYLEKKGEELDARIVTLHKQAEALREQREHDIAMIVDVVRQQILAYQTANVESRSDRAPSYFGETGLTGLRDRVAAV
ncbi:MAG: hypothetical protein U9R74_11900 [Pseudomonadota bacterium]|nr:hypothetical protein [Pseudomonadota bacterium]